LWEAERGVVETAEKTLAIPVMLDGSLEGYIYDGHSKLVLDTVIETKQGAIGRPVEKEINQPFLMLGNIQKAQQRLSATDQKDLSEMGYANQEEFISNAEDLLNKFFRGARTNECRHSIDGLVFAFQNETNKLDILIATGTKLVYKTTNTVFLSNRGKVVLKNPSRVVCVSNGKSILVER
jgi:hypothetical protein